jgi:4-aminobutyrate aminotransferase-like enzyme
MPGIGNVLKIKPPLIIEKDQATTALNVLDDVLTELES